MPADGFCGCGCGQRTNLAPRTDSRKGWRKGEPMRYLPQHQRRSSPVEYVVTASSCWEWQRSCTPNGYGLAWRDGRKITAHRLVYERERGAVPVGLELDHLCRNRRCVNPDHLEPVDHPRNCHRGARAKLTWRKVREMRSLRGRLTNAELGERFGISRGAVSHILNGHRWKDDPRG